MAEEPNAELLRLAFAWVQRFGEPPPILTDAVLLQHILDSSPPSLTLEAEWPRLPA